MSHVQWIFQETSMLNILRTSCHMCASCQVIMRRILCHMCAFCRLLKRKRFQMAASCSEFSCVSDLGCGSFFVAIVIIMDALLLLACFSLTGIGAVPKKEAIPFFFCFMGLSRSCCSRWPLQADGHQVH